MVDNPRLVGSLRSAGISAPLPKPSQPDRQLSFGEVAAAACAATAAAAMQLLQDTVEAVAGSLLPAFLSLAGQNSSQTPLAPMVVGPGQTGHGAGQPWAGKHPGSGNPTAQPRTVQGAAALYRPDQAVALACELLDLVHYSQDFTKSVLAVQQVLGRNMPPPDQAVVSSWKRALSVGLVTCVVAPGLAADRNARMQIVKQKLKQSHWEQVLKDLPYALSKPPELLGRCPSASILLLRAGLQLQPAMLSGLNDRQETLVEDIVWTAIREAAGMLEMVVPTDAELPLVLLEQFPQSTRWLLEALIMARSGYASAGEPAAGGGDLGIGLGALLCAAVQQLHAGRYLEGCQLLVAFLKPGATAWAEMCCSVKYGASLHIPEGLLPLDGGVTLLHVVAAIALLALLPSTETLPSFLWEQVKVSGLLPHGVGVEEVQAYWVASETMSEEWERQWQLTQEAAAAAKKEAKAKAAKEAEESKPKKEMKLVLQPLNPAPWAERKAEAETKEEDRKDKKPPIKGGVKGAQRLLAEVQQLCAMYAESAQQQQQGQQQAHGSVPQQLWTSHLWSVMLSYSSRASLPSGRPPFKQGLLAAEQHNGVAALAEYGASMAALTSVRKVLEQSELAAALTVTT